MSKVITFSRTFPEYHPKAGQPTYFVEKIWKGLWDTEPSIYIPFNGYWQRFDQMFPSDGEKNNIHYHTPKWHTIRAGHRWKVGDTFSPRVWSGRPYNSKMVTIAADVEIKKVWDIEVDEDLCIWINCDNEGDEDILERLAANDGLSLPDLQAWFHKPMAGQIICWSDAVEY